MTESAVDWYVLLHTSNGIYTFWANDAEHADSFAREVMVEAGKNSRLYASVPGSLGHRADLDIVLSDNRQVERYLLSFVGIRPDALDHLLRRPRRRTIPVVRFVQAGAEVARFWPAGWRHGQAIVTWFNTLGPARDDPPKRIRTKAEIVEVTCAPPQPWEVWETNCTAEQLCYRHTDDATILTDFVRFKN